MVDRRKIIMDVDTGSDDAIALCMAMLDPDFDLLGICSVGGNLEAKLTTDNSLRVVECCDKQGSVKVYRGAERPIAATLIPWGPQAKRLPVREGSKRELKIHKDHLPLPEPSIKEENESAVAWLLRTLLASDDGEITIVAVGPLTNIALAMRADERILKKINSIYIMGGGHETGNETASGEFNIWADPEAAEIVLQSGCEITMVPLDATSTAKFTDSDAEKILSIGTKPARLVGELLKHRIEAYQDIDPSKPRETAVHDALALCAVIHPEVLTDVRYCTIHTDISGGFAYGYTILDQRGPRNKEAPNCHFALCADRYYFVDYIYRVLEEDRMRRGL